MPLKDRLIFATGILISVSSFLLVSLFFIGVSVTDYSQPEESFFSDVLIGVLLGFIPLAFGLFLCRRVMKRDKQRRADHLENTILKLVAKLNGKITIAELAQNTKLSIKQAESTLEYYVKIGVAERLISEGGVFVYYFPNVLSKEEKQQTMSLHEF